MLGITMNNPTALVVEAERHLYAALRALEALKTSIPSAASVEIRGALKRPNGRMTPAGVAALQADFELDKLTISEIAEKFQISISGVKQRKKQWRTGS
jgi:hypothetical protein